VLHLADRLVHHLGVLAHRLGVAAGSQCLGRDLAGAAGHGRIETRTATVSTDIGWLQEDHHRPGLAAIGKVVRFRETPGKTTTETAYDLISTALSGERFNEVGRFHWGAENRLHWRLDVAMNEDHARNRLDNGPQNLAVLRHMALNVMPRDPTKGSLGGRRKRAGWDDAYLSRLLALFRHAIALLGAGACAGRGGSYACVADGPASHPPTPLPWWGYPIPAKP
jgi:predicted transposase YbfD/YdcC